MRGPLRCFARSEREMMFESSLMISPAGFGNTKKWHVARKVWCVCGRARVPRECLQGALRTQE